MLASFNIVKAQEQCGTTLDSASLAKQLSLNADWQKIKANTRNMKQYGASTSLVPMQIHIIRASDGSGGISAVDAQAGFDKLNEYYINASIHFYQCSAINYIDSDTYYDYDRTEMDALDAAHSVANVVNVYIAFSATSGGSSICGHAQFPGGLDFVMLEIDCFKNGSTLAHEVGHYLGLLHTHETAYGAEAVDGSDCLVDGDLLCDTPADPNLSGVVDPEGCGYIGVATDENGDTYAPSVTNVMSYATRACRYEMTEDQLDKMLWTLQNQRAYLTCTPPVLEAFFYTNPEQTCSSTKEIAFYNASKGSVTSYAWNFGDGVGTSASESPSYTYASKGVYTVTLTVGDGATTDDYTMNVVVGAVALPYLNDFEAGASSLDQFEKSLSMKNSATVDAAAAESGSYGLVLEGPPTFESPYFETPTSATAFETLWNPYYKAELTLCVNATYYKNLQLEFDKKQLYGFNTNYTNFRITVNGSIVGSVYQVVSDETSFSHITVDLSAYDGQIITIGFEGSHKYDKDYQTTNGNATFIDNIEITATPTANIWNGSVSTDWNIAGNWDAASVPTSADTAVVPIDPSNQPHVTLAYGTPAQCADLNVESGATLTIDAGKALTASGNADNEGTIIVKADATGIGSFIDNGTITGSGTFSMEQYVTGAGGATPNGLFYYVSSPTASATSNVYSAAGTDKLWSANESTQSYPEITNNSTSLNVAEGYVARLGATGTKTLTGGKFNTGATSASGLSRTGTIGATRGYNLVGNPYPSTVSWDDATKTNLETTMYYRTNNGSSMLMDTYNASGGIGTNNNGGGAVTGDIPPTQAFWVRVDADGNTGQLDFSNAMRSHGAAVGIYKMESEEGTIRIALSNGSVSDEQIIMFNSSAQDVYDDYDSQKFWAKNAPQLYTTLGEDTLTINGLNSYVTNPTVLLGMKVPSQGNYTLNATSITFTETPVYLEDKELKVFQNLNTTPIYSFNSDAGNIGNRFALHFSKLTGINEVENNISVFAASNTIYVNLSKPETGQITVLDMSGRIVHSQSINADHTTLNPNTASGIYVVRVETSTQTIARKISLQ
ncbi:PKD domain-containing protein [Bacteroidota bacterium]